MSDHPANLRPVRDRTTYWSVYRKELPVLQRDEVVPHWQNGPGSASFQGPGAPLVAWQGPIAGNFDAKRPDPNTTFAQRFLTLEAKPNLGRDPALWSGTKILGKSDIGIVGLWSYTGPEEENDPIQFPRKIVVKETLLATGLNQDIEGEHKIAAYLSQASSSHIVKLIHESTAIAEDDPIALRQNGFAGKICRLYFEYCPLGDLKDLIEFRESKGECFLETTLWLMFRCLIEGCMALETGIDRPAALPDSATGQHLPEWGRQAYTQLEPEEIQLRAEEERARREEAGEPEPDEEEEPVVMEFQNWDPIIHFDIKPRNIFLSRDMQHSAVPICKIGDFGLCERTSFLEDVRTRYGIEVNKVRRFPYSKESEMRRWGTPYFYTPEQFTKRWDYADWRTSAVAGNYTSAMNIWGIGNIMYSLIKIRKLCVDISKPFKPTWTIQGTPAKGVTYGKDLERSGYSKPLRDAVWACLYEKPANRPTSFELLALVEKAYAVARDAAEANDEATNESWNLFVTPWDPVLFQQPQPPAPVPAAAPVKRGRGRPRKNPLQGLVPAPAAAGRVVKRRGRPRKLPEPPSGDSYRP